MTFFKGDLAFLNNDSHPLKSTKAYFLHTPYSSDIWRIGSGNDAFDINWNRILPNGMNLLSIKYSFMLNTVKRFVFECRHSDLFHKMSDRRHNEYVRTILYLCDWTVYQEKNYQPHIAAFSNLDNHSLRQFVVDYSTEGCDGVLKVEARLQKKFNEILVSSDIDNSIKHAKIPPELFYENTKDHIPCIFSQEERNRLRIWLYNNKYYEIDAVRSKDILKARWGMLNRRKIGVLIGIPRFQPGPKVEIFLRQFEFVRDYAFLQQISAHFMKEYIPANFESTEELANKPIAISTIEKLMGALIYGLQKLTDHMPGLPSESALRINYVDTAREAGCLEEEHTRTIPVPIALHTLNMAIKYVINYGDALIDYLETWLGTANELLIAKNSSLDQVRRSPSNLIAFDEVTIPKSLDPLNIKELYSWWGKMPTLRNDVGGHLGAKFCREAASFEDATNFLVTSVFIIIATILARRREELVTLEIDCLNGSKGAYEVGFYVGKNNFEDKRLYVLRPIPDIAARGINMLLRLNKVIAVSLGDSEYDNLFNYFSDFCRRTPLNILNIEKHLHRFSDFIEIPLDEQGRRWYVLAHEFRRFYAIVFFWQFKFSNISALQYMLAQAEPDDVYDYIKESVGSQAMSEEEARYSASAICQDYEDETVAQIRSLALKHFKTNDISLIEEDNLLAYLEELIDEGVFKVRPHGFVTEAGVRTDMVFELIKEADNVSE